MSTPTTATATLPPHAHYRHPHYPYSHQPPYQHPTVSGGSSFQHRTTGNNSTTLPAPTAASSTRLPPPTSFPAGDSIHQYVLSSSSNTNNPSRPVVPASNGVALVRSDPEAHYSNMSTTAIHNQTTQHQPQPARKRRRSREPDWNSFYRNGLPKEIIVIEDTPPPSSGITNSGVKVISTDHANRALPGPASLARTAAAAAAAPATRHATKRQKREDDLRRYDPVHHNSKYADSSLHTVTPTGSTISTDRTTISAHNTTAATSLSSNGYYDDAQAGQKRKRTRHQIAQEAKKREIDVLSDICPTYKPPPYPPKKAADVPVRVIHDPYPKNTKYDDDDGHYVVVPDADLTDKYQMVQLLGQGTFGKVVKARDRKRNKFVAIKIIRSVQKYRDASRIELRVLATLKANDEENRNRCIHLRDCFDFRGHICIVMDLLGQSVFDFLKGNNFVPFPNSQIQSFARQLFTSVAFLHDLNLIHTDLKPENILLCNNAYQTFTYNRKIPSSSTTVNRQANQRRVLLDTEIRLIDFGSATFQDEYHSSVVSTRHYRAPEIILGLGWSFPCDIWSIGCILVEFFTGDALFQTHDNLEHLAMMEMVVGHRIDTHLVQSVNRMAQRSNGNPAAKFFKRNRLDYPTTDTTRASRRFVKAMKHLSEIIPQNTTFLKNFLDLLKRIFVYDPAQRITAKEALNHPFFKEPAQPDDGTEAARIRLERSRIDPEGSSHHVS